MNDDVQIWICGGKERTQCSVPGCGKPASTHCVFELSGAKAGMVCGKDLCSGHGGDTAGLCPPHHRRMERALRENGE